MGQYTYSIPAGTTWTPVLTKEGSVKSVDHFDRQGRLVPGIFGTLKAKGVTRHTNIFPDPMAQRLAVGAGGVVGEYEIDLTLDEFNEVIVIPMARYAMAHPEASEAEALDYVLSQPVTVSNERAASQAAVQRVEAAKSTILGLFAQAKEALAAETPAETPAESETPAPEGRKAR